jgi:3-hydroxyacyl-CoA dehydrogenase
MSLGSDIAGRGVAIVGAGLVGIGWAIVFARAGLRVRVHDSSAARLAQVPALLAGSWVDLQTAGLIEDPAAVQARVTCHADLADAVAGVGYIQESVLESVAVKRALYERLDALVAGDTRIGSSSSGIPSSAFTEGLSIAPNCLVAHPVNPPYLARIVELVPAPWTTPQAVEDVHALMQRVDQHPIRVTRELEGFVLNRLQGALLREAWALYDEGYCSLADLDATISQGLGLRWSFMGPFETIDLNAPEGTLDYCQRYGENITAICAEQDKLGSRASALFHPIRIDFA